MKLRNCACLFLSTLLRSKGNYVLSRYVGAIIFLSFFSFAGCVNSSFEYTPENNEDHWTRLEGFYDDIHYRKSSNQNIDLMNARYAKSYQYSHAQDNLSREKGVPLPPKYRWSVVKDPAYRYLKKDSDSTHLTEDNIWERGLATNPKVPKKEKSVPKTRNALGMAHDFFSFFSINREKNLFNFFKNVKYKESFEKKMRH